MKKIRGKLTFANVIACVALFVALGGASYAATQLPKNSVGATQLKKAAVTPPKLSAAAKATLTGPIGPAGPTGAQGPKGDPGSPGADGRPGPAGLSGYQVASSLAKQTEVAGGTVVREATCPAGTSVLGGGARVTGGAFIVVEETPGSNNTSWEVRVEWKANATLNISVLAICAKVTA